MRQIIFLLLAIIGAASMTEPKVGLVLSGGGARGFAHIGVLKAFEREKIPIDYIAGTSMGALIGGLYASGYSAAELEAIALKYEWIDILKDNPDRRFLSFQKKQAKDNFFFNFFLDAKGIQLPLAIKEGQEPFTILNKLLGEANKIHDFNQLKVPFLCIATDIATGQQVVLNRGNLVEALRASMAVPSVIAPVEINGQLLVDGGVVNNFPAEEMRQFFTPDYVVGVDIGTSLYVKNSISDVFKLLTQTVSFYSNQRYEVNVRSVDVFIQPDLHGLTFFSFSEAQIRRLIQAGEQAAYRELDKLKASLSNYKPTTTKGAIVAKASPTISAVVIDSLIFETDFFTKKLKKTLQRKIKESNYSPDILQKTVTEIYNTGLFQNVYYTFSDTDPMALQINVVRPKKIEFGVALHYDNVENFAGLLHMQANYRSMRSILVARIARNMQVDWKLFWDQLYDALGVHTRLSYFTRPWQNFEKVLQQNTTDNTSFLTEIRWNQLLDVSVGPYFSHNTSSGWLFSLGVDYHFVYLNKMVRTTTFINGLSTSGQRTESLNLHIFEPYAKIKYDNLDNFYFPMKGIDFDVYYSRPFTVGQQMVGQDFWDSYVFRLKTKFVFPIINRHFSLLSEFQLVMTGLNAYERFPNYGTYLGGVMPMSYNNFVAFPYFAGDDYLHVKDVAYMQAAAAAQPIDNLYIILYYQFAYTSLNSFLGFFDYNAAATEAGYHNLGVELGYDSILGPLKGSVFFDPKKMTNFGFYLSFGYWL